MFKSVEGKGCVTVNGISKDRWMWSFIPHVPLTETDPERSLYSNPDGTYAKYKLDIKKQQLFTKDQFLLALQMLGYFEEATEEKLQNLA